MAKIDGGEMLVRTLENEGVREIFTLHGGHLDAIYAAFGAGWPDPGGLDPRRQGLADEAIWLGRVVVALLPEEPEALGLLALMLYAGARRGARRNAGGEYVPLSEQDPSLWDAAAIEEAEYAVLAAALARLDADALAASS